MGLAKSRVRLARSRRHAPLPSAPGRCLRDLYLARRWARRAWTWHEAADTTLFGPRPMRPEGDLVWIGNWGDGERSEELVHFLLKRARAAQLPLDIYGVRYPDAAKCTLKYYGARYHGWVANAEAPQVFSTHLATVHVPRRFYTKLLPGIPTIRVFEALACGIPLVSAPWDDCELLFRAGEDFLMVHHGAEMTRALQALRNDPELCANLARNGLDTIIARHTCAHRAEELLTIVEQLRAPALRSVA